MGIRTAPKSLANPSPICCNFRSGGPTLNLNSMVGNGQITAWLIWLMKWPPSRQKFEIVWVPLIQKQHMGDNFFRNWARDFGAVRPACVLYMPCLFLLLWSDDTHSICLPPSPPCLLFLFLLPFLSRSLSVLSYRSLYSGKQSMHSKAFGPLGRKYRVARGW